jgi:uncharacterized protein
LGFPALIPLRHWRRQGDSDPWMCQNSVMDRMAVISKLRQHEAELRAAGLVHVRIFGSTARDESSPRSDVDLLVDLDPARRHTLVSLGGLQSRIAEILSVPVDLSAPEWMREPVRTRALEESVLAF